MNEDRRITIQEACQLAMDGLVRAEQARLEFAEAGPASHSLNWN